MLLRLVRTGGRVTDLEPPPTPALSTMETPAFSSPRLLPRDLTVRYTKPRVEAPPQMKPRTRAP